MVATTVNKYQIWCNNAVWSGTYTLTDALRRIGELAARDDLNHERREWVIRIVKLSSK
jgi:hypothetical protein